MTLIVVDNTDKYSKILEDICGNFLFSMDLILPESCPEISPLGPRKFHHRPRPVRLCQQLKAGEKSHARARRMIVYAGGYWDAPGGNSPGGNSPGGNSPGGNSPGGNSPGGNSPGGNSPGGNSPGGNSPGGNSPGGNSPGGNSPGGNSPGGNSPGGNSPGGNSPGGNSPGGNSPGTIIYT